MRRSFAFLAVVVVLSLGLIATTGRTVSAQEATPSADMSMEGLTFTLIGLASGVMLPGTADLQVARAGFAPGAGFPFDPNDPSGALVIMESGTLTARVEEQAWMISRGGALQQAMEAIETAPDLAGIMEEVAMGEEATLEAGDVAYVPGGINGGVRNNGQEPAEALIVIVGPEGMIMSDMSEATPAP